MFLLLQTLNSVEFNTSSKNTAKRASNGQGFNPLYCVKSIFSSFLELTLNISSDNRVSPASKSLLMEGKLDSADFWTSKAFKKCSKKVNLQKFELRIKELSLESNPIYELVISSLLLFLIIEPDIDPFKKDKITEKFSKCTHQRLINIIIQQLNVVEIQDVHGKCSPVVFPATRFKYDLNDEMKMEIMEDFDVQAPSSLFKSILLELKNTENILTTKYQYRRTYGYLYRATNNQKIYYLQIICILLACGINAVFLAVGETNDDNQSVLRGFSNNERTYWVSLVLTIFILIISGVQIVLIIIFKFPLFYIRAIDSNEKLKYKELLSDCLVSTGNFLFHIVFGICAFLISPFFHTLHLLLFISLWKSTFFIVKVLLENAKMFFTTAVLMILTMYAGSFAVALEFTTDFDD